MENELTTPLNRKILLKRKVNNKKDMLKTNISISEHQNELIRSQNIRYKAFKSDTLNPELSIWYTDNLVNCV
jgi:hypothetical protein